jgi:lipoyl(octanoyl) transferase
VTATVILSALIWISPRATGWLLARIQTSSWAPASSVITGAAAHAQELVHGHHVRPSTTEDFDDHGVDLITHARTPPGDAPHWALMLKQPLSRPLLPRPDEPAAGWAVSAGAVDILRRWPRWRRARRPSLTGSADELVWLLEHPPLYHRRGDARPGDLLQPSGCRCSAAGAAGQFTYHGPGQRVAYVMLDLNVRGRDVRAFVSALEAWIIGALGQFNVRGEVRPERVGVWVRHGAPTREDKIAAIGVKLRRWVSFHGISLNVEPELAHFGGIVPCGINADASGFGVTSLVDLGLPVTMDEADGALRASFEAVFGTVKTAFPPL